MCKPDPSAGSSVNDGTGIRPVQLPLLIPAEAVKESWYQNSSAAPPRVNMTSELNRLRRDLKP
jgi:hypothetical protein